MIRAIVVDDEQPALDKMAKLLGESSVVDIKGTFTNPVDVLEFLKETKIDAVFLDIEMPGMNGLELSNHILDLQGKIAIIFVTAYNDYAVEAFRLNALDYLMKPVERGRLKETLDRIIEEKNIPVQSGSLYIKCFGGFKVFSGANEIKFRTSKAAELLALLVDCRGMEISRSYILDRLWSEFDGDKAATNFNTTLHNLKKALFQHGVEVPIQHFRGMYSMDTGKYTCDFCWFQAVIHKQRNINDKSIKDLEEVISMYNGEYMTGIDYYWTESTRVELKEAYIKLLLDMAKYYKSKELYHKVVEHMKAGIRYEPANREINYYLVEALMLSKDRITAVKCYDSYKRRLKSEYGLEPDLEIKKLLY